MEPTEELVAWILSEIERGESQRHIAEALGIGVATLNRWLYATPERSARVKEAMGASAEAWLDKGMNYLISSMWRLGGVDSNAARALAQECARRAAIRNPAYREKTDAKLELTGANGGPVRTLAATLSPEEAASIYKDVLG